MIQPFTFKPTPALVFGAGKIMELPGLTERFGRNLLLVVGGSSFTSGPDWPRLEAALTAHGCTVAICRVDNEPTPEDIDTACELYRVENFNAVVAIGGGSVLDAGKAISAMLAESGSVVDFLEGVGTRKPSGSKLPFIAIPTTSGTGSEATSNAVISSVGSQGFKKSLRHDNYIPNLALLDPQLTVSCPSRLTVACGMDTFSQLVEAYLSTNSSAMTDALALDGIRAVLGALPKAVADGGDLDARTALSYGSYLSGIVLANAGLGTVHGFASALGGYFPIPHGIVCGTLMAEANRLTLSQLLQQPETTAAKTALHKYATLGRLVNKEQNSANQAAEAFIAYLQNLTDQFDLPRLAAFGVCENDFERIIAASSNKFNPVHFTDNHMQEILRARL